MVQSFTGIKHSSASWLIILSQFLFFFYSGKKPEPIYDHYPDFWYNIGCSILLSVETLEPKF